MNHKIFFKKNWLKGREKFLKKELNKMGPECKKTVDSGAEPKVAKSTERENYTEIEEKLENIEKPDSLSITF